MLFFSLSTYIIITLARASAYPIWAPPSLSLSPPLLPSFLLPFVKKLGLEAFARIQDTIGHKLRGRGPLSLPFHSS